MKKLFDVRPLAAAVLFCAALLGGCGSSKTEVFSSGSYDSVTAAEAYNGDAYYTESPAENAVSDVGSTSGTLVPQQNTGRKIVYTADVSMESKDFEATRTGLLAAVEKYDAYMESSYLSGSAENGNRYLSYTIRVPVEHYTEFLDALGETGSVLSMNENAQDITSSYIDVEARLAALEAQRDRLNELAETAQTTTDLLEIEKQLSEVQYQLEDYTRQLNSMEDSVSYSTVYLNLSEVQTYTPTAKASFGSRIREAFGEGWDAFVCGVQDLAVALVYLLPVLVVLALVAVLIVVLAKRSRKRRAAKGTKPVPKPAEYAPAPTAEKDSTNDSAPKYQ